MTEVADALPPKTGGKLGLIVLIAVVALAGGGGFSAGMMGLIPNPFGDPPAEASNSPIPKSLAKPIIMKSVTYHSLPELMIPLGKNASSQYLRTKLYLEIDEIQSNLLKQVEPRIMDTLNIFLRSVDERDVSSILAMEKLRAEMLRRVRLITGDDAVHAVLIGEFLLR